MFSIILESPEKSNYCVSPNLEQIIYWYPKSESSLSKLGGVVSLGHNVRKKQRQSLFCFSNTEQHGVNVLFGYERVVKGLACSSFNSNQQTFLFFLFFVFVLKIHSKTDLL